MAEKGKVKLPSSQGGIMQYYDEYSSKLHITPMHVIIMVIVIMILVILLNIFNPFGF